MPINVVLRWDPSLRFYSIGGEKEKTPLNHIEEEEEESKQAV